MPFLPYNPARKQFSRQLRNNSTLGEVMLWRQIKSRSLSGYPFNRQKPLNNFIVDFYCSPLRLVIEIDGEHHNDESVKNRDEKRQKILESMGLNFLRFSEKQVRCDLQKTVHTIQRYIADYEDKFPEVMQKARRNKKQ
jgi:very-short-patch-repair endonuclease